MKCLEGLARVLGLTTDEEYYDLYGDHYWYIDYDPETDTAYTWFSDPNSYQTYLTTDEVPTIDELEEARRNG